MSNREIDAMVAEHVMGWEGHVEAGYHTWWVPAPHRRRLDPPKFSEDIRAAWEVVEKMRANGRQLELYSPGALMDDEFGNHAEAWVADFTGWEPEFLPAGRCEADTAPLCIALAALRAVGVEVED